MNINIPGQFRTEFDSSANFAVEKGAFTPTELAEHIGRGVFVASIMVGYMEKAGLVTKGKGEDVRYARITLEEWDAIGRSIENYVPAPETEVFSRSEAVFESVPEPVHNPIITVTDIITDKMEFIGKTIWAEEGIIAVDDGNIRTDIFLDSISALYIHKGKWLGKNTLTFSSDAVVPVKAKLRADTVAFKKRDWLRVKELADNLAQRLEIEVKTF